MGTILNNHTTDTGAIMPTIADRITALQDRITELDAHREILLSLRNHALNAISQDITFIYSRRDEVSAKEYIGNLLNKCESRISELQTQIYHLDTERDNRAAWKRMKDGKATEADQKRLAATFADLDGGAV